MRQLTGMDASFLRMETPRMHGHTSGLQVLDPSTAGGAFSVERLRAFIAERLHLLEPLRWRLVEVPFGLDLPYWVDVWDVDLDWHVKATAVPSPGDDRQLAEQVARIAARQLDRRRPLWEMYLIEGLQDGRVAVLSKFHHAAVDGMSSMKIVSTLLDSTPEGREMPPPDPDRHSEPVPSEPEMLGRGWLGLMRKPAEMQRLHARVMLEGPRVAGFGTSDAIERSGQFLNLAGQRAPRTPFNRSITQHRAWAFGTLPLRDVKAVKNACGCTVNDVVMSLCAAALRRWLLHHDALPDRPLLAMVPVSIRAAEEAATMGNQVSGMIVPLPTHLADPVARLKAAHEAMRPAKEQFHALPATLLQEFTQFSAPAAMELFARIASAIRPGKEFEVPFNVAISNIPGPRETLYYAGAEQLGTYPLSMIADGMGMNISLISYRDSLDFGIVVCPDLVPDVWSLIDYLREDLAELVKAI